MHQPSYMMKLTADLPPTVRSRTSADAETHEEESAKEIDDAIAHCRNLLDDSLFNARTRREYDAMFDELRKEGKVEKVRQNIGFLERAREQAASYEARFKDDLETAVSKEWIDAESKRRWMDRFNDPNVLEWTRKEWMQKEFPKRLKNWQEAAEKREEAEKLAKAHGLTAKQIPELADIFNKKELLGQPYQTRKNKVDKAMALILAYQANKMRFLRSVEREINDAIRSGWMHASKAGAWMERVMKSDDPETFASTILLPFIQNWRETREDFDKLNNELDKQGIPRGFRPVKVKDFLLMNYKQRTSYCALARLRLGEASEQDKALASATLRIRHDLDTKDWEGAAEGLSAALKEWPDNRELHSMQTYLECHRKAEEEAAAERKESPDPRALLHDLRGMLRSIEGELHAMYVEAAEEGPNVFNRLLQISYNRVWVHENGYLDPSREIRNARDRFNHQMTEQYMRHGHGDGIEHNILDGETAAEEAIRYDSDQPQMLYMGTMGRHAVMEAIKDNADNEDFGYGTTLIPQNTHYAIQARIVNNLHYPMKNTLRQLHKMGYRFTIAGSLVDKNGVPAFSEN